MLLDLIDQIKHFNSSSAGGNGHRKALDVVILWFGQYVRLASQPRSLPGGVTQMAAFLSSVAKVVGG